MSNTNEMPYEEGLDHSLSLMREGYMYIKNRRSSFASDIFETRLLGQKTICMGGKEATKIFYDNEKFKRNGAAPKRVVETLFGEKGVQTLDGQAHKHRKEMFMSLMSPEQIKRLNDILKKQWEIAINEWKQMDKIVLYEEAKQILCITACQWAGVPLKEDELKQKTKELSAMFEAPAAIGPEHWQGRYSRNKVEKWMDTLIDQVRDERVNPTEGTALHTIAWHKDPDGNLLDTSIAAVEVINILRPIVAIAIYINFTALAVHHFPEETEKLSKSDDGKYAEMFVQEVRRFYPFFPFAAAKVKKDFTWNGYIFKKGILTLLDLYGTNHDPEIWNNPDVFQPERFVDWEGSPFDFIPQGGGDYFMDHRCAGEWVTMEVMKVSLDYLMNQIDYEIPNQDLSFSLVNIPSIPKSSVVLKNIEKKS